MSTSGFPYWDQQQNGCVGLEIDNVLPPPYDSVTQKMDYTTVQLDPRFPDYDFILPASYQHFFKNIDLTAI